MGMYHVTSGHYLLLQYEFLDTNCKIIIILDNCMYSTKVLCVNYTTYNVHWDQDSINPATGSDIMVYSPDTGPNAHPYWYACPLGIFHACVLHISVKSTNHSLSDMEFLWVCWFGHVPGHHFSMKAAQLPKVGFVPEDDQAFGFLDPSLVVWGCHLIPSFCEG